MFSVVCLLCVALIIYTYAVYPALIILWARYRDVHKRKSTEQAELPFVSFIVAVHNEERRIARKIRNCLQIRYPPDKIEFIIVSDGSTDNTNKLLEKYNSSVNIRILMLPGRKGKTAAQEIGIEHSRGEVLVFSDASTLVEPDAVMALVRRLQDGSVGLVAGEDVWEREGDHNAVEGQSLYVRYEMAIRKAEGVVATATASSGCFYAVRRFLRPRLEPTLIDDFATPLSVIDRGFKVVTEPEAKCYVPMTANEHREFERKARIVAGGVYTMWKYRRLLNPFRTGIVAWQLWSHKMLRWSVPFLGVIMFAASVFWAQDSKWGQIFLGTELAFLVAALLGWLTRPQSRWARPLRLPFFLVMSNCAVFVGVMRCLLRGSPATWEPSRRQ